MKKKYRFITSKLSYIITSCVLIILTIGIIVNILSLVGLQGLQSGNLVTDIIGIILMIFTICIISSLTFASHYTVSDKYLGYVIGFIWRNIKYDDILFFRNSESKHLLLMYYKIYDKKGKEDIKYLAIRIKDSLKKDFIKSIKTYNNNIIVEEFDDMKENNTDS